MLWSYYRNHCLAAAVLATAFSTAALADQSGNAALTAGSYFDPRNGAISSAGGDILWNGTSLAPQGQAGLYNLGRFGSRVFKSITARSAARAPYSAAPIPSSALIVGDIFGVQTNGGQYAKVSVTAVNGTSISLQYTTFIAAARASRLTRPAFGPPPFIYQVQNNYSYLLPGVPNYGIAPGSLFAIQGMNLNGNRDASVAVQRRARFAHHAEPDQPFGDCQRRHHNAGSYTTRRRMRSPRCSRPPPPWEPEPSP